MSHKTQGLFSNHGLTSQYALDLLQSTIYDEVSQLSSKHKRPWLAHLKSIFGRNGTFVMVSWVSLVALVFEIILMVSFIAVTDHQSNNRFWLFVLELFLLAIISISFIVCCLRENRLRENEIERLIKDLAANLSDINVESWKENNLYPQVSVPETDSISLVWTYRDNRIVNLPWNLLVEGDVVVIGPGRKAPAHCRQLFYEKGAIPVVLEPGEIFVPPCKLPEGESKDKKESGEISVYPRQLFEIIEAPVKDIISCYYKNSVNKRSPKIYQTAWQIVNITEKYVIWAVLVVSLVVNLVRWKILGGSNSQAFELMLLMPGYVILPLLPLIYPVLWIYIGYYGSARLQALYESRSKVGVTCNDSEEIVLQHVNCEAVLKTYVNITVYGSPRCLPRTINLAHTLGSLTTFSCVDKEGILCYPEPVPEKVFFFKEKSKVTRSHEIEDLHMLIGDEDSLDGIDQIKTINEKEEVDDHFGPSDLVNDIEIMSIFPDPKNSYGMQFDDIEWKEQLASLRPISSNIILNSPCTCPMKTIKEDDFLRHVSLMGNSTAVSNARRCMCPLANYIGYPDHLRDFYRTKQRKMSFKQIDASEENGPRNFFLSIVKEKHVPFMTSSVVSDGRSGLSQLFTQGSGDLILEACTDLWNGDELCPLKDSERKKALNFFQRMNITRNCVAFAYRPLLKVGTPSGDEICEFMKREDGYETDEEEDSNKKISSGSFGKDTSLKNIEKDLQYQDLLVPSTQNNSPAMIKDMQKQIFLGMLTMVHTLKEDLINMIDILHFAGIRFVHFSYENELLSRVFCQRLGLETGWNCHISLGDATGTTIIDECSSSVVSEICPLLPKDDDTESTARASKKHEREGSDSLGKHGDEADEYDDQSSHQGESYYEPYFMSNRSKLPKGIQNMRSHLSEIDDVPLLVPLFTECSASAVTEMTCIRQEYGDIVCCIGSSMNARNYTIFTQSDVSIALEPIYSQSCSARKKDKVALDLNGSCEMKMMDEKGPLALSAAINSITCSLASRRIDNFPISDLICEARRLLIGFQNLFLFLFSSCFSITLLLLFISIFLLPPPLTGLNILWLICVILPLLSTSLVGTSADKSLMKLLTGKRRQGNRKLYKELIKPYLKYFIFTFGSNAVFITVILFPWLLYTFCIQDHDALQCHWLLGNRLVNKTSPYHGKWYGIETEALYLSQDIVLFTMTLSFVILSTSFIHRTAALWRKYPTTNKPWCLTVLVVVLLQILYNFISYHYWRYDLTTISLQSIPLPVYFVVVAWLVLLLMISELIKKRSIRDFKRFQKRERLKFDTKLGMNSPV